MDRRGVLAAGGSLFTISAAGCAAFESESEDPPEPVVGDVRVPAVEHVDGDVVPPVESIDADSDHEFAATFENAGDDGEAAISLYLLEADETDGDVLTAGAPARVTLVHFAAGERRDVVVDDVSAEGYDAYFLEAQVGSVEADVRNDGEEGLVEIALTSPDGETTDERRTLELDADATETVSFDGPFVREAYDVRVKAADE
ncbi:hypothetical protein [Natrinema longum]|uniref:Uncharacterized protein n=1 Tax=Natrinema longum TaxID=370324 RepID=A0A8A2UCX2_9EURY|nr:hypothetical protein [Natrinema longum]MBZ6495366.1 hypothetical protein [Natrinema longum]QSW86661.1 hypothetical protein J0X27_07575 [Natrinema longum]